MPYFRTRCVACGTAEANPGAIACNRCGAALGFDYDDDPAAAIPDLRFGASMWRHWRRLPVIDADDVVTLGEGGTPLLSSSLTARVALWWKDETRNPTGSHKDRALSLALTHARRLGARTSLVVSAGSTGLSNAAYAARAGLASVTLIPARAPEARLYPLSVYGSRLIEVAGSIDELIEAARMLAGRDGIAVASTTRRSNPVQGEAAKTIAHEIVEQRGDAPDWMLVPVGGGGTIAALWRGFREARACGAATQLPRLAAIVPATYDALAVAWRQNVKDAETFAALPYRDDDATILTKLSHAHPPDGLEALVAIRESGGVVLAVSDEEAVAGTRRIASADGLYLEPSAGVSAPALERLLADGTVAPGCTVVGLACGSGFRETFVLAERAPLRLERIALRDLAAALA